MAPCSPPQPPCHEMIYFHTLSSLSLISTCLILDSVLISLISICSPLFQCLSPYLLISYLVPDLVYKPNRDPETNQFVLLGIPQCLHQLVFETTLFTLPCLS